MRIGKCIVAAVVALSFITTCAVLPVRAEENFTGEPVAQESLPQETLPQETLPQETLPSETTGLEEMTASDEIVPAMDTICHYVRTMDDLVAALGAGNVAVSSPTTIRIISGIDTTSQGDIQIIFDAGTYDIDFQGHQVRLNGGIVINGGSVTLRDTSEYPYGGVTANIWDASGVGRLVADAITQYNGELIIHSGCYTSSVGALSVQGGTTRIEGGDFYQRYSSNVAGNTAAEIRAGDVTIHAGIFQGSYAGIILRSKSPDIRPTIDISGGSFASTGEGGVSLGGIYIENSFDADGTPHLTDVLASDSILLPASERTVFEGIASDSYVIALKTTGAEGFVYRLYAVALGRYPDYGGYRNWFLQLRNEEMTGSKAAYGFIFSTEMNERGLSDREFITILYNVFLQRTPDQPGMNYWVDAFLTGVSREYVFAGFANSTEWKNLCAKFGIAAGSFEPTEARDKNFKVTQFVSRLYKMCLNRSADVIGLNYWTGELIAKTSDGAHVAQGFFFSQEMKARNLSNEAFVDMLYNVLLGRAADAGGKANWVAALGEGKSRFEIFRGFVRSAEFTTICENYGITRGTI